MRHVINREINAHDDIGDPGQLMGVYDAAEEENIVARAYQAVKDGAQVIAALEGSRGGARCDVERKHHRLLLSHLRPADFGREGVFRA